jgi:hypothetical protein
MIKISYKSIMTFLKIRKRREVLRRTVKPTRIVFGLVAAVAVVSVGYIMTLAILAPEQLAEATTAATDLVCSGCVGTSDIANSAVTSGKIGSGQVKNSDIGGNAVTSTKIQDGQVGNSDLGPSVVTSPKIADFQVGNGDLGTDAVTTAKIKNGEIKTEDLAPGAVKPNVREVRGSDVIIAPGGFDDAQAVCAPSESVTGGGFFTTSQTLEVTDTHAFTFDGNDAWLVSAFNGHPTSSHILRAFAYCIGPSP